jgi:hypothetical protein
MSSIQHRIGIGTTKSLTGKNNITAKPPIRLKNIMTADSTIYKADSTIVTADGIRPSSGDGLE